MGVLVALGCAAPAAQASLGVPTGGPPTTYTSLAAFEAAAGGADNGTTAGEQGGGFRHITWDGIPTDGTDPGSTTIEAGSVIAPARSRLQQWGLELGAEIAVSSDGFHSVNPSANFTPFSAPNVWAPFNSNVAELDVVSPDSQAHTPVPAQSRGLGVVFLNVTAANQTEIQYYNGDILLGHAFAPTNPGGASFAGLLFPDPVVTRVLITLGTAEIFDFDGSTASPGPSTSDRVAGDDVALAEPAPARGAVAATAGVPVTTALDAFTETNSSASPTALIEWGDGTRSAGTITSGPAGTLLVSGNHAYGKTGSYLAEVTVDDSSGPEQTKQIEVAVGPRSTATAVTCSPSAVAVSASATCTATVSDVVGGTPATPAGVVSFSSSTPGAAFPGAGTCLLGPTAAAGVASCAVQFTPGQLLRSQARVAGDYGGDGAHAVSEGTATVAVHPQRCTLKALTRRLRAQGLGVLVTCDARANVQIAVQAKVARRGRLKGFQLRFGTLRASVSDGRPTVLVVKPGPGVLVTLRGAIRRHQRISLKLTLTASSHATTRTTTTRVSAVRLS